MGLKENFSQAVKDLTGNSKDDDKRRNSQYEGLKRALDNDQPSVSDTSFSEGTSRPYYRSKNDDTRRGPQDNPQYNGQPRNSGDGFRGNDRGDYNYNDSYGNGDGDGRYYNDNRRSDDYRGRDGGYYNDNRQDAYYDSQRRDGYFDDNRDRSYSSDRPQQGRGYDYDRAPNRNNGNDRPQQDRSFGNGAPAGRNYNENNAPRDTRDMRDRPDGGDYNQGNQNRAQGGRQENFNRSYNNDYGNNNAPNNTYPSSAPMNQNGRRDYRDAADNEITVISKNTMIDGNVRSLANMSIDGNIKGDVETTKDIELNGRIVGNMTCNNANMITSQVQGNLMLKGSVEIGRDTLLIGDLNSGFASINGKVKGNVEISGKAEFKADAVIFGDISASTITVDDGAIIQGYVSTTFLNKDESEKIFPEFVEIGE